MPGKGRPPQAIPSPISRHIITCYVRYQGSKHTVIYILVQTIMSVQAKLEVVRKKHIVHLTGFGDDNNNNDNDKIRVVNITGARGNQSVWWQVTTSNGIYLCVSFYLRIFHFMFAQAGSIEVFRHDIMEHISEIRAISRFCWSMLTCCTIKPL